jgi:hypothetical protein
MKVYYENSQVRITKAVLTAGGRQCQIRQIETHEALVGETPSWGLPGFGVVIGGIMVIAGFESIKLGQQVGASMVLILIGVAIVVLCLKSLISLTPTCYLVINGKSFYASKDRNEILNIQNALNEAMEDM